MLFIFFVGSCNVWAQDFDITSKNVILYNMNDNEVIYEKNSNEKVEIASLTKIMTAIVAIEKSDDLNKQVVIDNRTLKGIEDYAQAGFKVGDKVSIMDLLYGVLLPSGADAVNAIAINAFGGKAKFVSLMNEEAKKIGLKDTEFDNPIGMDSKNNYSTASDLGKLLSYALKNDTFKKVYTTKRYKIDSLNLTLKSTLLTYGKTMNVDNIKGAKSGFTDGAGLCLASIANYSDVNYMLVVLGASPTVKSNAVRDSLEIYNYYDKNYGYKKVIKEGQLLKKIKVKWGKKKIYEAKSDKDVSKYLKKSISTDDLSYDYKGLEEINYKNKKGDKLGVVDVKYNDKLLVSYDVYLNEDLKYYHPVIYSIIAISIILMLISLKMISSSKSRKKKKRKKKK